MSDDNSRVTHDTYLEEGANQATGGNVTIKDSWKSVVFGVVLGLSVLTNVVLIYVYRDAGTEERLRQYNLDWFKSNDFAQLKADVEVNKRIADMALTRACTSSKPKAR